MVWKFGVCCSIYTENETEETSINRRELMKKKQQYVIIYEQFAWLCVYFIYTQALLGQTIEQT